MMGTDADLQLPHACVNERLASGQGDDLTSAPSVSYSSCIERCGTYTKLLSLVCVLVSK